MSIIVLLSPIHSFLLRVIIYKSKTTIFSIPREIIITSLIRKLTKVSSNFKKDINGISDRLEMCKNIFFLHKFLFTNQLGFLSHVHRKCILPC